jgi:hypothetical protein
MTIANIVAGIALAVWGLLLAAGISGYQSVLGQHVAGYPTSDQFHLLLSFPTAVVSILLLSIVLANWKQRGAILLTFVSGGSLFVILPWVTVFSGRV